MNDDPSHDDVIRLARQAGLDLPAEYLPDLIEAYGHVRRMIDRIPAGRARGDEPAHIFEPRKFTTRGE
jgi:hypothetical protein